MPVSYCAVMAFLCQLLYSYTTSPLYWEPTSNDSAVFQIVGKYWAQGFVPYISFWDHKGPMIHFLNCLGYMLTGTATGVFVIQCIFLAFTLYVLFQLLQSSFSTKWCFLFLLIPLERMSLCQWGNCVEEYLLPLLALAYACAYKWVESVERGHEDTHPAKYAFVYGMVLAFSLLTRLTNAVGICGVVAVVTIWLFKKGKWENLGMNILSFLLGFALLVVPFFLYFESKNALGEMWYATWGYNVSYAESTSHLFSHIGNITNLERLSGIDAWLLLLSALVSLRFLRKHTLASAMWVTVAILSLLWFYNSADLKHYEVISIPLNVVSILELARVYRTVDQKSVRISVMTMMGIFVMLTTTSNLIALKNFGPTMLPNHRNTENDAIRAMMKDVPKSYRLSFLGYNSTFDYYLYDDIRPACRFFVLQDFQSSKSPVMRQKLIASFDKSNVKWVLFQHWRETEPAVMPVLKRKYYVYKQDKENDLILYHIKKESTGK